MSAAATVRETASMFRALADHAGPYTRKGQYEVTGERLGLTPRRSLRLAHGQWKQMPAHIADAVRALYIETCEALDESARQKIEANDAASEKRRRQRNCVDGGGDGPGIGLGEREGENDARAEADKVND